MKGGIMSALHVLRALAAMAVFALPLTVHGQPYPNRPVRMIVPDAPGGSPDQLGRLVAQKLSEELGQPVFVDNKPGAAGVLATEAGAKSAPDGYTVTMVTTAIYAILPYLNKNLPYDAVKDFIPVSRLASSSNVLVVNASLPVKSVADLVQLAKSEPGVLNYASAGVGSPAHLAGEMLNLLAGIKLVHIPYKGSAPALMDVIGGTAQMMITSPLSASAHMKSGRVRALATTGKERNPALPDLPTVADTLPGYEITQSLGIVVPAGTPPDVVKRIGDEFARALTNPEVRDKILKTGAVPASNDSPAAFNDFMQKERARLGDVVTRSKIELKE
jgi:tripartite-type tricarboxylate transporter receptor subunit TctC